ncbi:phenol hydroxylase P4 protein [Oceanisphaera litoralis]|uniref:phenol hydroxylase subunit P4 n=1 Tax=Oceanisphaera litoralis TaxID=225144 RepID=UPI00195903CC|nr:phenol hydroxylase subunit P4 [Oceanisphaera litoralis]MBM7456766.1 phenol hydroxylase P4 protein [Oceanisphaera litoralis]
MPVVALKPDYRGAVRDAADQFNGQQLLFVEWSGHLSISAPIAVLVDPEQAFADFIDSTLQQSAFASHSDWPAIDWQQARWRFERRPLHIEPGATFASLGVGHKAFLTLHTPDLNGI